MGAAPALLIGFAPGKVASEALKQAMKARTGLDSDMACIQVECCKAAGGHPHFHRWG